MLQRVKVQEHGGPARIVPKHSLSFQMGAGSPLTWTWVLRRLSVQEHWRQAARRG